MIIVEGGDNVGKSTVIRQLQELDTSLFVLHRQRFNPKQGETIGESYLQMLLPGSQSGRAIENGIADRFLASECIYGQLFRGGCRLSMREHFVILSTLISYSAIVVFCDPPDESVQASWSEREQTYPRDPLCITKAYRQKVRSIFHPLPIIRYDWTAVDAEARRSEIVALNQRAVAQYRFVIPQSHDHA